MKTREMATGIVAFEQLESRLLMSAALGPQVDDGGDDGGNVAALAILSPGGSAADTQYRAKVVATADVTTRVPPAVDQNLGTVGVTPVTVIGIVSNATADRDYVYQLTIPAPVKKLFRKFSLKMGTSADADIDLLRADGTLMVSSEKWGNKAESLKANLAAGTYYLRVHISSYYTWTITANYALTMSSK